MSKKKTLSYDEAKLLEQQRRANMSPIERTCELQDWPKLKEILEDLNERMLVLEGSAL